MKNYKDILSDVNKIYDHLISLRRTIHQYPELAFMEFKTSKLIQDELSNLGIKFEVVLSTGVVASIGQGERCIALRADIDALPIQEETGADFSSTIDGVMHACGHDTHTTMLLGAAALLKKYENKLKGRVLLIFQPGEEKLPGGASQIIDTDIFNSHKPEIIFGQHVYPSEASGIISVSSGYVMASADELYWTITGKSAHAAQPHLGRNPVIAASNIISQMQTLVNSVKNPVDSSVLTVTSIHGGSAPNIIPEKVNIMGTLRTFNNNLRFELLEKISELSNSIAMNLGCKSDFSPIVGYPPLNNDKKATSIVEETAMSLFGQDRVTNFEPKMWAEDFAYYNQKASIPSCFWFLGVQPDDIKEMPGLHHPKFLPDEKALITGAALLTAIAVKSLE